MVTFSKNEIYGYGSRFSLKSLLSSVSYSNLVRNLASTNLAKEKLHIKYGFDKVTYQKVTTGLGPFLTQEL